MIDDALRLRLVAAIDKVPLVENEAGRTALLGGIHVFQRNPLNRRGDIMIMILQLEENYDIDRNWRLLKFIDNAAAAVSETDLGKELQTIRQELQQAVRPRTTSPAETAQVHLFDLREPVMMCVAQLPPGGISGFVVPAATPRLLRYFCDSLRHRGAKFQAWTRDRVAIATASPLVVGPLKATIVVATSHVKKLQQLQAVKHVFWPVYVEQEADAHALWQSAQSAFEPRPENHLIVVFGVPEGLAPPVGMKLLPSPEFTSKDVEFWLGDIAKAKAWQESLLKRWTAVIVTGYTLGGPLPMDEVYDRLERYHSLLNEYRNDEQALLQELQDLETVAE